MEANAKLRENILPPQKIERYTQFRRETDLSVATPASNLQSQLVQINRDQRPIADLDENLATKFVIKSDILGDFGAQDRVSGAGIDV